MNDGPGMPARALSEWAKEILLAGIDEKITALRESADGLSLDDETALKKQRARVARFLGLK